MQDVPKTSSCSLRYREDLNKEYLSGENQTFGLPGSGRGNLPRETRGTGNRTRSHRVLNPEVDPLPLSRRRFCARRRL